ncbi:MAG: guanylate kinase [bacterium]
MQDKIFVISGPSGVGKGSIIDQISKKLKNIHIATSATTREPRKEEEKNKRYYFISKEEFQEKIKKNAFIEYCKVHNNFYGTLKTELNPLNEGKIVILEIDTQGAEKIKTKINGLFIFIAAPSQQELKKRLENRGTESKEKIEERLKNAKKELQKTNIYDYVLINKKIEESANLIIKIIQKERMNNDK